MNPYCRVYNGVHARAKSGRARLYVRRLRVARARPLYVSSAAIQKVDGKRPAAAQAADRFKGLGHRGGGQADLNLELGGRDRAGKRGERAAVEQAISIWSVAVCHVSLCASHS